MGKAYVVTVVSGTAPLSITQRVVPAHCGVAATLHTLTHMGVTDATLRWNEGQCEFTLGGVLHIARAADLPESGITI